MTKRERDQVICSCYELGMPVRELATALKMTSKDVRAVLTKDRKKIYRERLQESVPGQAG
jgi:hypothetical protein